MNPHDRDLIAVRQLSNICGIGPPVWKEFQSVEAEFPSNSKRLFGFRQGNHRGKQHLGRSRSICRRHRSSLSANHNSLTRTKCQSRISSSISTPVLFAFGETTGQV